jgi:hypothetical protein
VLVSKYADYLPLYHRIEIYARESVALERSIRAGMDSGAAALLKPLLSGLALNLCSRRAVYGRHVAAGGVVSVFVQPSKQVVATSDAGMTALLSPTAIEAPQYSSPHPLNLFGI